MKHKHEFKTQGGGCLMRSESKTPCDLHYACECGVEFKLLTSRIGYMHLPESFTVKEWSELKKAEFDTMNQIGGGIEIEPSEPTDDGIPN